MENVWKGYHFHQYIPHYKGPFKFFQTSWLRNFTYELRESSCPPPWTETVVRKSQVSLDLTWLFQVKCSSSQAIARKWWVIHMFYLFCWTHKDIVLVYLYTVRYSTVQLYGTVADLIKWYRTCPVRVQYVSSASREMVPRGIFSIYL